ncbi:hypothetical protein Salat_0615400 [Sesamum alatum]|uniref:Uncharacterized protein n=1 Tax=Sesamum alatum TaxID=300844 RepID=A0AAE2CU09_9LAMI|nr:hypothetical protein Salat_0615400 [Sesamum alatum]
MDLKRFGLQLVFHRLIDRPADFLLAADVKRCRVGRSDAVFNTSMKVTSEIFLLMVIYLVRWQFVDLEDSSDGTGIGPALPLVCGVLSLALVLVLFCIPTVKFSNRSKLFGPEWIRGWIIVRAGETYPVEQSCAVSLLAARCHSRLVISIEDVTALRELVAAVEIALGSRVPLFVDQVFAIVARVMLCWLLLNPE